MRARCRGSARSVAGAEPRHPRHAAGGARAGGGAREVRARARPGGGARAGAHAAHAAAKGPQHLVGRAAGPVQPVVQDHHQLDVVAARLPRVVDDHHAVQAPVELHPDVRVVPVGAGVPQGEPVGAVAAGRDRRGRQVRDAVLVPWHGHAVPVDRGGVREAVAQPHLEHLAEVATQQRAGGRLAIGPGADHPAAEVQVGLGGGEGGQAGPGGGRGGDGRAGDRLRRRPAMPRLRTDRGLPRGIAGSGQAHARGAAGHSQQREPAAGQGLAAGQAIAGWHGDGSGLWGWVAWRPTLWTPPNRSLIPRGRCANAPFRVVGAEHPGEFYLTRTCVIVELIVAR